MVGALPNSSLLAYFHLGGFVTLSVVLVNKTICYTFLPLLVVNEHYIYIPLFVYMCVFVPASMSGLESAVKGRSAR